MTLPLAAGASATHAAGTDLTESTALVDPGSHWLDQVAADWAARGGFDDDRRPWVLTVFGLAHQLTHATVAHLMLADRVLDLGGLRGPTLAVQLATAQRSSYLGVCAGLSSWDWITPSS